MRSIAFSERLDPDWARARSTGRMMAERLQLHSPEEEEMQLEAGFVDVALFYAVFSFGGGVAVAG
jgi:tRNA (cmo5U34)-methyltransferase